MGWGVYRHSFQFGMSLRTTRLVSPSRRHTVTAHPPTSQCLGGDARWSGSLPARGPVGSRPFCLAPREADGLRGHGENRFHRRFRVAACCQDPRWPRVSGLASEQHRLPRVHHKAARCEVRWTSFSPGLLERSFPPPKLLSHRPPPEPPPPPLPPPPF